ncbi:adipocyte plasma membrane-associated protein-like, partial [Tachypleus tridentatus]|uniref:adipocyte plasma membrane-associated protein-like n=1 Tax=Tachypleus tridentatus TaxID=6853 RepID=UPI003FD14482
PPGHAGTIYFQGQTIQSVEEYRYRSGIEEYHLVTIKLAFHIEQRERYGDYKCPSETIAVLVVIAIYLVYAPGLLDINPVAYSINIPNKFEGPLAPNNELSNAERLFENEIIGPESVAALGDNLYTGTADGNIVCITGKKIEKIARIGAYCEGPWEEEICGRPLGMRFDKNGSLYVLDAYYGLMHVNVKTGTVTPLLPYTESINNKKLVFPNDLTIDDKGIIYFTDASTRWPLKRISFNVLEHDNQGRVIKFDPSTKETEVLLENLYFPNGIQLSADGNSLLIAESNKFRIIRYYFQGPNKGKKTVFAKLPGEPDNIRPSKNGGYWVALCFSRHAGSPTLNDRLAPYPAIRKLVARLLHVTGTILNYFSQFVSSPAVKNYVHLVESGKFLLNLMPRYGMVVELDKNGKIIRSLQSSDDQVAMLSEVLEHNKNLYIGSFINPFLLKLKA